MPGERASGEGGGRLKRRPSAVTAACGRPSESTTGHSGQRDFGQATATVAGSHQERSTRALVALRHGALMGAWPRLAASIVAAGLPTRRRRPLADRQRP